MSDTNGTTPDGNTEGMGRILLLSTANKPKSSLTRAQRAEAEKIAHEIVTQECAKVHEHYLQQIPNFVARMIQDALMTYGLIVPQPGTDIAPKTEGNADAGPVGSDAAALAPTSDGPDIEPALEVAPDTERPTDPMAHVHGEQTEPAA